MGALAFLFWAAGVLAGLALVFEIVICSKGE